MTKQNEAEELVTKLLTADRYPNCLIGPFKSRHYIAIGETDSKNNILSLRLKKRTRYSRTKEKLDE